MSDVIMDAVLDSVKLIPFLFITYLVMGILEQAASDRPKNLIKRAGKVGPLWGALIGVFPQCGFSAAASYFYVGRVITLGTLISIYMSTSDEMLPILISQQVSPITILKILGAKVVMGMISGFAAEFLFGWITRRRRPSASDMTENLEEAHDHHHGIVREAFFHTLKVFVFIFLVSLAIGTAIHFIGEQNLAIIFSDIPVLGEAVAGLVGLIPNCAASVVITQLYLEGVITAGPMMSGLLVSAGVGLLVLFKEDVHIKESLSVAGILYIISVAWGVLIELMGITF